ncbi:LysR family transcriptional regulator [Mesorhizobium sp. CA18]|uniref:LysR substrate-binding domain-containing protein n=1 Tax=unclassified Mesorhizobium TaxID=325217 RepID=UPI001CCC6E63|nr:MULTISPECIES: LysR substrate-binding domain-containing protein [unclassified Mesorhizobium]MBZ9737374.1 LysR family transcriptional regulator [Mesorhizobium sp. CA9]MBZ9829311.1 LysR family transcriptional regulator [Mesorhizobium sp. CA18]MBZ9834886.1 LysR family transcriptional regulator [Mesorhizobium sp. CA2]MBZ9840651.1 LysR family transcriptional regulator [Mesorhizobium sp. CA3]MBZ9878846.1 LysR family transcriptional regulator [Mesorhizobium sp. Ca11]
MAGFAKLVPSARGLLVFEAAVRTGSFTAAAREFNVTQPSISRSIAQLEAHLGVGLFARGPAGLAPTAEARALYAAVSGAFEGIEGVIGTIRKNSDARPVVTLSLSSSLATHWFVPRLGAFDTRFPNVDLRFELIAGVLRGPAENVDLATRFLADDDTHYHHWPFCPEIIVPVCSPSYLSTHGQLVHAGNGEGHVLLHLTDAKQQWQDAWGSVADRKTSRAKWLEFSDYAVVLQGAMNGQGVALGWLSNVSTALLQGTLVRASDRQINTGRTHQLVAPPSRPLRPIVSDIAAWMIAEMQAELERLHPLLGPDTL